MQEISVGIFHINRRSQESSVIYEYKGILRPKSRRPLTWSTGLQPLVSGPSVELWVLPVEILFSLGWGAVWTLGFFKRYYCAAEVGNHHSVPCWRGSCLETSPARSWGLWAKAFLPQSSDRDFSSISYIPGTILSAGDRSVSKQKTPLPLRSLCSRQGDR